MDRLAINTGFSRMKKADLDWLTYENQSGEWSVFRCEAFDRHLKQLSKIGSIEGFWYGWPERLAK